MFSPDHSHPFESFGRGGGCFHRMNPTHDRYRLDLDAALLRHFRQIPGADALLAALMNAHQDELNRETTPLEHPPLLPPTIRSERLSSC